MGFYDDMEALTHRDFADETHWDSTYLKTTAMALDHYIRNVLPTGNEAAKQYIDHIRSLQTHLIFEMVMRQNETRKVNLELTAQPEVEYPSPTQNHTAA